MAIEVITIRNGGTSVAVIPRRGGLVADLTVDGLPILYLDRSTVDDETKSVRGGIPILFPFAGKLVDNRLVDCNTVLPQHGFARNKVWTVERSASDEVDITLRSDEQTREGFPFDFVATQKVRAISRGLRIELSLTNTGRDTLPFSVGWHPYFACHDSQKSSVTTDIAEHPERRFRDDTEFDFGLPAPWTGSVSVGLPGVGNVVLSFSPELRHLQFWSQPEKSFVCIEPFWGPANTINSARRGVIEPGMPSILWLQVEAQSSHRSAYESEDIP